MPLFRLTPIPDRLVDPAWRNSTRHDSVETQAVDEQTARTQVSHACQAWVESRSASRVFWVSPWEDPHLVTCVQMEESSGASDDHAE
jgi:hypothetical protein